MPESVFEVCPDDNHDFSDERLIKLPPLKVGEKRFFPNVSHLEKVCLACGTKRLREI